MSFAQAATSGESRDTRIADEEAEAADRVLAKSALLLSRKQLRGMVEASVLVPRAIERALYDYLGADPERIAQYLELEGGADYARVLLDSASLAVGSTRCDLVQSRGEWKVIEVNATNAGGWLIPAMSGLAGAHGDAPLGASYREAVTTIDTPRVLFRHLLDEVERRAIAAPDEPVSLGLVVPETTSEESSDAFVNRARDALARAIASSPARSAHLDFVTWSDATVGADGVSFRGRRLHVVFETAIVESAKRLLAAEAARRGRLLLVSGPFSQIGNDKRLLALVSQLASDGAPWAELASTVPWTRCMRDGRVGFHGEDPKMSQFVRERRQELVLKKALSAGGAGVFVGRAIPRSIWDELVDRALLERNWIVQEWVEPETEAELAASIGGTQNRHLVWGAFAIGGSFAGGFARALASDGYRVARGATRLEEFAVNCSDNSDERVALFPFCWRESDAHIARGLTPMAEGHEKNMGSRQDRRDQSAVILHALLENAAVADAHIVPDQSQTSADGYVGYAALSRIDSAKRIVQRIADRLEERNARLQLFIVSHIPRRSDGAVDQAALEQATQQRVRAANVEFTENGNAQLPRVHPNGPPVRMSLLEGGPLGDPSASSLRLADVLERAARDSAHRGIRFLDAEGDTGRMGYPELQALARRIAGGLRAHRAGPGTYALLVIEPKREFLAAFWGSVLAGVVPVPCAPPSDGESNEWLKLKAAWQLLGRPPLITSQADTQALAPLASSLPGCRLLEVEALANASPQPPVARASDDVALLLMTSGSSGMPKFVLQTHRTLLAYCSGASRHNRFDEHDVSLNWFPFDHVGGLVMFHLRDVWLGCEQLQAPTSAVLARPLRWLDWIDRYRVSITWAPNFAFALVSRYALEIRSARWDLSCLRFILNGGEAVIPDQARLFMELLEPHGLARDAMHPAWGMSETCSGVAYAEQLADTAEDGAPYASVGVPIPGCSLRVVDGRGRVVPEGESGQLEVRGESVTPGYHRNREANAQAFTNDGWFRTGDLAFSKQGRLTIIGRVKDVVIINGRNYACSEIEAVAARVPGVRASFVAAVALRSPNATTDRLAVVFVPERGSGVEASPTTDAIRRALLVTFQCASAWVLPVTEADVPKTSLGKIRRAEIRERLERLAAGSNGKVTAPLTEPRALSPGLAQRTYTLKPAVVAAEALHPTALALAADSETLRQVAAALDTGNVGALPSTASALSANSRYMIDLDDERVVREELAAWFVDPRAAKQLMLLLDGCGKPPSAGSCSSAMRDDLQQVLGVIHTLVKQRTNQDVRLRVVAFARDLGGQERAQRQGAIGAIGAALRSARAELPWLRSSLLVLQGSPSAASTWTTLQRELECVDFEEEVAYTARGRTVPRLCSVEPTEAKPRVTRGGLYLVAGGLGGVGAHVATHLLRRFETKLLLVGRTPDAELDGVAASRLRELEALGSVLYATADVTDATSLRCARDAAEQRFGVPLSGVFNLAGVLGPGLSFEQPWAEIEEVLRPKCDGTWAALELMQDRAPGLIVLFSSLTGLFGGAGIGAHAAACAYQDSFARAVSSGPSGFGHGIFSIAWSTWRETGQSANRYDTDLARARGYLGLEPEQALGLFDAVLGLAPGAYVAGIDPDNANIAWQYLHAPKCLDDATAEPAARATQPAPEDTQAESQPGADTHTVRNDASCAPRSSSTQDVAACLRELWCEVLDLEAVRDDENFFDLGGHSLVVPRVVEGIAERLGVEVKAVDLFRYSTIHVLSERVSELLRANA